MSPSSRTLQSKRAFRGRIIQVDVDRVREPGGIEATSEVVRHAGSVVLLAVDTSGRVLLIRQYRYAAGGELWEVPAGKLDAGEDPIACARRELEEEAGCRAGRLEALGPMCASPGFTDEQIHLFAAFDLEEVPQRLEADEVIEVERMPFQRALDMVWSGEISDAKSQLALLKAAHLVQTGLVQDSRHPETR